MGLDWHVEMTTNFLPNIYVARIVHINNCHEISLQIGDTSIKCSMKADFPKHDNVQNSVRSLFGKKKKSGGVIPQQNNGGKHIQEYSRLDLDQIE